MVICGECRDILCIEALSDVSHCIGTVVAKSALPHRQLESDVVFVLPGKVRNRREFAGAARSMAVVAGLKFLLPHPPIVASCLLRLMSVGDALDREQVRGIDACVIRGHVGAVVRRQRLWRSVS